MSREFGSYCNGYFHTQMSQAADDCRGGREQITRLWGDFLAEFAEVAYSISSCEASDSCVDDPIMQSLRSMPHLEKRLAMIRDYLEPFKRVAETAVREAVEKKKK